MRMASGDALRLTIPTQVCLPTFEHLQQMRQSRQPPQMSQQPPRSRWISEIHRKIPSESPPLVPKISFSSPSPSSPTDDGARLSGPEKFRAFGNLRKLDGRRGVECQHPSLVQGGGYTSSMQHDSGQYCTVYRTPGSRAARSEHDIDHVANAAA